MASSSRFSQSFSSWVSPSGLRRHSAAGIAGENHHLDVVQLGRTLASGVRGSWVQIPPSRQGSPLRSPDALRGPPARPRTGTNSPSACRVKVSAPRLGRGRRGSSPCKPTTGNEKRHDISQPPARLNWAGHLPAVQGRERVLAQDVQVVRAQADRQGRVAFPGRPVLPELGYVAQLVRASA
jgi:hypothetical protein